MKQLMDFASTVYTILFIAMDQMELSEVGITNLGKNITIQRNFQILSLQEIKLMMDHYLCMLLVTIGN